MLQIEHHLILGLDGKEYKLRECCAGPFMREIILPQEADIEQSAARMENGVLKERKLISYF